MYHVTLDALLRWAAQERARFGGGTLSVGPSAAVWLRCRLLLILSSEFRAGLKERRQLAADAEILTEAVVPCSRLEISPGMTAHKLHSSPVFIKSPFVLFSHFLVICRQIYRRTASRLP
jgi:hypothetical protein